MKFYVNGCISIAKVDKNIKKVNFKTKKEVVIEKIWDFHIYQEYVHWMKNPMDFWGNFMITPDGEIEFE